MTPASPAPEAPVSAYISIAREYTRAKEAMDAWEGHKKRASAELLALHGKGEAPTEFKVDDYTFSLAPGRKGETIDDEGKEQIARLKEELAKEGHIEEKQGDPFWNARKARAAKAKPEPKRTVSRHGTPLLPH